MNSRIIFLVIFALIISTSCNSILSSIYGVNELKEFELERCEKFLNEIDFSGIDNIRKEYWDQSMFSCYSDSFKYENSNITPKDLSQPVQLLYVNQKNNILSFHANCYAQGNLSGLNWNFENRFDTFPPVSAVPIESSTKLSRLDDCSFGSEVVDKSNKIKLLIIWTMYLEKISKDAIEIAIQNIVSHNTSIPQVS